MSKPKVFFIISLILLMVILVFTVFRPITVGGKYKTVLRDSVIRGIDRWTIEFNIINNEGKNMTYTVIWSSGGESKAQLIQVGDGRIYNHIHFVYPETVIDGTVNLIIYKEDESTPFEQATYYVSFD